MDVGVDWKGRHPKGLGHDDRRGLVADPRKPLQSLEVFWNQAAMLLNQDRRESRYGLGLLGTESTWLDDLLNTSDGLFAHRLGRLGEFPKFRCDSIDHLVGALGAEHDSNQQGIRVRVFQRDIGAGVEFIESPMNDFGSLLAIHRYLDNSCGEDVRYLNKFNLESSLSPSKSPSGIRDSCKGFRSSISLMLRMIFSCAV